MTGFERPRYFGGKLVTAEDFELEQRYHIEKRWLLNRMLQGVEAVPGLGVVAGERGPVTAAPGFALDPHGREILVCESQELAILDCGEPVSICLLYTEVEAEPRREKAVVLGIIDPDGA